MNTSVIHRSVRGAMMLLVIALLAPAMASAQDRPQSWFTFQPPSRGMLGILTTGIPEGSYQARQRLVLDVVEEGPAKQAGVQKGDTIVSINGLAATSQAMNLPFEPGDTVTLRLRRDGRERDVTIVAVERPDQYRVRTWFPDSIGERMTTIMGNLRLDMDSVRLHVDSIMRSFDGEGFRNVQVITKDSIQTIIINGDTVRTTRVGPVQIFRHLDPDSLREVWSRVTVGPIFGDTSRFNLFFGDDSTRIFSFGADTMFMRPFEVLTNTATLGMRAVAGAELATLNPGLAEYFGATDGVLVLNARDDTPAARAGLRSGDVITHADGATVTSINELRRHIARFRDEVTLRVLRAGRTLEVKLRTRNE